MKQKNIIAKDVIIPQISDLIGKNIFKLKNIKMYFAVKFVI